MPQVDQTIDETCLTHFYQTFVFRLVTQSQHALLHASPILEGWVACITEMDTAEDDDKALAIYERMNRLVEQATMVIHNHTQPCSMRERFVLQTYVSQMAEMVRTFGGSIAIDSASLMDHVCPGA